MNIVSGILFFTVGLTWVEQLTKSNQQMVRMLSNQKTLNIKDSALFVQSLSIVKLFVYVRTALYMLVFIHVYDVFKSVLSYVLNRDRSGLDDDQNFCIRIYGVVS